jgi:quinol monooxygenase YgiN
MMRASTKGGREEMYGTVAKFRIKAGSEGKLRELVQSYESLKIPGHKSTTVYRMDSNPNEFYMAVIFNDKDSYTKNADSPEQDSRYRQMVALLEGDPEWHDGEIIYSAQ